MAPVGDYSTTPGDNTAISGLAVSDATIVSTIDDIIRQLMADIRLADDANMKLTGDQTATGTKSFATVAAGFGRITTASASRFDLQATSVADTHERTRLVRDTTAFRHQTTNSGATVAVDDYVATIGATGVTEHAWSIEGVERFSFDGSSYTFASPSQARTALGITATAGSPTIIDIGGMRVEIGSGTTDGSGGLTVSWAAAFSSAPRVFVTPSATSAIVATLQSVSTTAAFFQTWVASSGAASASTAFNYIAIGPKA